MHTPFDQEWFAGLLSAPSASTVARPGASIDSRPTSESVTLTPERSQDWGDALDTTDFVGRADELALVQPWVLGEHSRLIAILGMGGVGKTSLASRVAQSVAPSFERVYWRSLRDAPPVSDWLSGAIGFLSDQQMLVPGSESDQITSLLRLLRNRRCLIVLDNSEALFEAEQPQGQYRAGYGRVRPVASGRRTSSPPELSHVDQP
jgi:hypothetical protein